jgi:hypothetical protein
LQYHGRFAPHTLAQEHGNVTLERCNPGIQVCDHRIELVLHGWDLDWPLHERMPVIARLLPHFQERIARDEPLPQFVIDCGRWLPWGRLSFDRELYQQLGIAGIRFGTAG